MFITCHINRFFTPYCQREESYRLEEKDMTSGIIHYQEDFLSRCIGTAGSFNYSSRGVTDLTKGRTRSSSRVSDGAGVSVSMKITLWSPSLT